MKLQRRIYAANLALSYFIQTHWVFKNANFIKLNAIIQPQDREDFCFDKFITGDVRKYFISCMYGEFRSAFPIHSHFFIAEMLALQVPDGICSTRRTRTCRAPGGTSNGCI